MTQKEKTHIITALVSNESGVLTRISGLFARRCYNIDSLSVCATEDADLSRMTISVRGDENVLRQIILQLGKLPDCKITDEISQETAVLCELLLVKTSAIGARHDDIAAVCKAHGAKIECTADGAVISSLTGTPKDIDKFVAELKPFGIIELSRTGMTALSRDGSRLRDKRGHSF